VTFDHGPINTITAETVAELSNLVDGHPARLRVYRRAWPASAGRDGEKHGSTCPPTYKFRTGPPTRANLDPQGEAMHGQNRRSVG
jgi:hypothetical protein